MSESISLFVTFIVIAVLYEYLKPNEKETTDIENDSINENEN
ncbi:MAG: hypothetical protein AB7S65_10960 [Sulfuricurvum sp.]